MYNQNQYQNNTGVFMDENDNLYGFSNKSIRLGFIRKTLGIFTL